MWALQSQEKPRVKGPLRKIKILLLSPRVSWGGVRSGLAEMAGNEGHCPWGTCAPLQSVA